MSVEMFSIDVDQCAPSMKAPEATWEPPAPRKTSEAYRPRPRKLQDRYPKAAVAEDQDVDLGHIDVQHRALSDELDTWDGHDEMLLAIDNYVRKRWLAASFVKWNDCRKKQCTAMDRLPSRHPGLELLHPTKPMPDVSCKACTRSAGWN